MSYRTPLDRFLPRVPEPEFGPGKVALVLVDLQHMGAHADFGLGRLARERGQFEAMRGYYDRVAAILPNVRRLLEGFRTTGQRVIHVRMASADPSAPEVNRGLRLRGSIPRLGSREADFLDEVAPSRDETVLDKSTMSAFNSTPLKAILDHLDVETVVVAGVVTNGCVELTARDAADYSYSVVVVPDACTAGTPELHDNALERMATSAVGLISVLSVDEVLARLAAAAATTLSR